MLWVLATAFMAAFRWLCRTFASTPWKIVLCAILCIYFCSAFYNFVSGGFFLVESAISPFVALCHAVWRYFASAPSTTAQGALITGTPTLSGLPEGVTAGGLLLSSVVAALEAAASATGAAPVASIVFPTLPPQGLRDSPISKQDWQGVALEVSKQSNAISEDFYRDLQYTAGRLDYILHAIDDAGNRLRNPGSNPAKDGGSWFQWPRGAESELKRERIKLQRMMRHFSDLLQQVPSAISRFKEDVNTINLALGVFLGKQGTSGDPGNFFRDGIESLNMHFESNTARPSASDEKGKKPISPDDPEAASFIQNLHAAQIVGSLYHGSFSNAKVRLDKLAESMEKQRSWVPSTQRILARINNSLRGEIERGDLLDAIHEVAKLAKEWRAMIEEGFFSRDE